MQPLAGPSWQMSRFPTHLYRFGLTLILIVLSADVMASNARRDTFTWGMEELVVSSGIDAATAAAYGISEANLTMAVEKVIQGIPRLVKRPLSIKSESSTEFHAPKSPEPGVYVNDLHVHLAIRRDPNDDAGAIEVRFVSRRGTVERRSGSLGKDFTMKVSCLGDCAAREIAERTRQFMDVLINNEAYPIAPNQ